MIVCDSDAPFLSQLSCDSSVSLSLLLCPRISGPSLFCRWFGHLAVSAQGPGARPWLRALALTAHQHGQGEISGCCPALLVIAVWLSSSSCCSSQGDEKQLSEKSLHPPPSPVMLPDHLKCNILKAQMEAAFRVSARVCPHHRLRFGALKFTVFPSSSWWQRKLQQRQEWST